MKKVVKSNSRCLAFALWTR